MRIPLWIAKGTIALVVGLAVGYGVGLSLAHDAAKGRALTLDQYMADFKIHKTDLESSAMPMGLSLLSGVVLVFAVFGLYELLAVGLARVLVALDRRTAGPPPLDPGSG